jgi:16S rRNA (guanine966-N2)-methyltransferase
MLRITGGQFKGRGIQAPASDRTRPTQAKLRQALFNSIQMHTSDARVLDLFAGSGALGFEALSRGATSLICVESSRSVTQLIEKNAKLLGVVSQTRVICAAVESSFKLLVSLGPFDLVLADPPYGKGWEEKILTTWNWAELLTEDARVCFEWAVQGQQAKGELPDSCGTPFPQLVKVREKKYGESILTTYRKETHEPSSTSDLSGIL